MDRGLSYSPFLTVSIAESRARVQHRCLALSCVRLSRHAEILWDCVYLATDAGIHV